MNHLLLRGIAVALLMLSALYVVLVGAECWSFMVGQSVVIMPLEATAGSVCHHRPERTLQLGGALLPVCARCTGIYLSLSAFLTAGFLLPADRRTVSNALLASCVSFLIGAVGASLEAVGWLSTSNGTRAVLGGLLGVVGLIVGLSARVCWTTGAPNPR